MGGINQKESISHAKNNELIFKMINGLADYTTIIGKCESRGRITWTIIFLILFRVLRHGKIWGGESLGRYTARAYLKVIKLPACNSNLLSLYYIYYLILNWFKRSIYSLKIYKTFIKYFIIIYAPLSFYRYEILL